VIADTRRCVSLEDAFWKSLKEIARGRRRDPVGSGASIDSERRHGNLSSAIRHVRARPLPYGRVLAGGRNKHRASRMMCATRRSMRAD